MRPAQYIYRSLYLIIIYLNYRGCVGNNRYQVHQKRICFRIALKSQDSFREIQTNN